MADYVMVLEMSLMFFKESPYKDMICDEAKMSDLIIDFITNTHERTVILALDDDGEPIGLLAGTVTEHLFSREKAAFEVIWWVKPDKRGAKASLELFGAFEYWAKRMGCKYIQFGAVHQTPYADKVKRLYERKGYVQIESNYLKAI